MEVNNMNNTTSKNNIPSTNSPAPEDIISANLKKLISQTGTTQKELAEKLGVAPASMSDYCNGRRIPNVEFFLDLKRLYNISIDDFLQENNSFFCYSGTDPFNNGSKYD